MPIEGPAYVKALSVRAFKSFGEERQKFTFGKGFNLIVGANGSGKSNILDAIAFALCTKTTALRVRYNGELQSTDTRETCEVVLELAMEGGREIALSVTIHTDDSRHYKLDGKLKSVKEVKEFLQERRLYLEGTAAIIHQSHVTELADNNSSKSLTSIISEASGAGRWNEEVERAQQELKRTRKGLDDIQENILLLEKIIEKDQECLNVISRIKQLESEVALILAELSAFLSKELLFLKKEIDVKLHLMKSEEGKIKEQQLILDKRKEHIKGLKKQLQVPIGHLESERMQLVDSIAMKEEWKLTYERKLHNAKDANLRLGHLDKVMQNLEEKVSYLNLQIEQKQGFVSGLERRFKQNSKPLHASMPVHFYIEELKDSIVAAEEKLQELQTQQINITDYLKFLSTKKMLKEEELVKSTDKLALLPNLPFSFNSIDNGYKHKALCHQKLQLESQQEDLKAQLQRISAELGTLSNKESSLPAWPLHSCFTFKRGLEDSSRYFLALNIISGSLKKTCVTETTCAAADMLQIWEKDGNISTFSRIWPLDRLMVEDRCKQQKTVQQKYPEGSVILPLELLDYDVKFDKAVKRVFGGYVISSSDEIAKDLILRHKIWSVTVDGKVNRLGSVTGGWRSATKSNYIQAKFENDYSEAKLNSTTALLTSVIREIEELETSLLKVKALSKEKEDLALDINNVKQQIKELASEMKQSEMELEDNQQFSEFVKRDMETNKKQLYKLKLSNQCLEDPKILHQALQTTKLDEAALQAILDDTLCRQERIKAEKKELQEEVRRVNELNQKVQTYQDELSLLAKCLAENDNLIEGARKEEEERSSEISTEMEAMENDKNMMYQMQENINRLRNCISSLMLDTKKAEKEMETLRQIEVNDTSLCKEDIRDKNEYLNKKRKLNSVMEELKKLKPQETSISLDEQIALNEHIGKLELFKERWMSIAESIDILTQGIENTRGKVQAANEITYQDIRQSFVECCKAFFPNMQVDLIKCGHFVEEGIKFSFCNGKGINCAFQEWKSNLDELSGGQRTVLSLAFIMMVAKHSQTSVYLMDEVDAALDEQNQQSVAKLIKNVIGEDNQVICVSHNIAFQRHCDRIIQVSRVDGSTKHVQTQIVTKGKFSKKKKNRAHNS